VRQAAIDDVLVDLVGDDVRVELLRERGDLRKLVAAEDAADRVERGVDDDGLGLRREGRAQLGPVEGVVRLAQRDVARGGARQDGVGTIVLVEGLEDHHLVARLDEGEEDRHHRLGGAARHREVPVGVHLHVPLARVLRGDRLAEARRAPRDRVLVVALVDRPLGGLFEELGRVEVGKPLGEVDAAVLAAHASHLPDHRLGEPADLRREAFHANVPLSAGGWDVAAYSSFSCACQ
jgi:hypothetical protein